jgi:hypothetical protein
MRPALSSLKVKSLPLLLENNHTISNASVRNANGGFGTMSQHFEEFTTTIAFMTGAERHSVFARKSKHVKLYLALGPLLHHHGMPGTVRR